MITRCTNADMAGLMAWIGRDYACCLYLYLDLMQFGCENPDVSVWLTRDGNNDYQVLALIYQGTCHLYVPKGEWNVEAWGLHLRSQGVKLVCAEESLITALLPYLPGRVDLGWIGRLDKTCLTAEVPREYPYYFRRDEKYPETLISDGNFLMRPIEGDEFLQVAKLLYDEANYNQKADIEVIATTMKQRWSEKFTRHYVLDFEGRIVGNVCTKAECPQLAIIGGLVIDKRYRHLGLGKDLISMACAQLVSEGKDVFSFYYSQSAAKFNTCVGLKPYIRWARLFVE